MTTPRSNPPPPIPPVAAICAAAGDPHMPVAIPANHPLALSTPFLGWAASGGTAVGGNALVTLSTSQMLVSFGARLSCAKSPADLPAADKVNPLTLGLNGAAWTRILNEYLSSGLLNSSVTSRMELITRLSSLVIATPANLQILASDWQLGEDTAGTPGVPGIAAVPAVPPAPTVGRRGQRGYQPAVAGAPRCRPSGAHHPWKGSAGSCLELPHSHSYL
ncbi:hypothetical protein AB1Y20_015600 [Prymnesium parvum]|uniref:Uncharacterized protein n=1 Tax=Prymnesium parvum TaxID=97485 RepID=A0AB34JYV8_PRYPA